MARRWVLISGPKVRVLAFRVCRDFPEAAPTARVLSWRLVSATEHFLVSSPFGRSVSVPKNHFSQETGDWFDRRLARFRRGRSARRLQTMSAIRRSFPSTAPSGPIRPCGRSSRTVHAWRWGENPRRFEMRNARSLALPSSTVALPRGT
jgi:hypothetical protein